jgi:hypothetical protein
MNTKYTVEQASAALRGARPSQDPYQYPGHGRPAAAVLAEILADEGRPEPVRRPSRRSVKVGVAVGAVMAVFAGGGLAAASGMFDHQARDAFATGNTYPFNITSDTATKRASARTPDGGHAQLWTATGRRDGCAAILLDDPGVLNEGKPYKPSAACGNSATGFEGMGETWVSRRTGKRYMAQGGRTYADARTVTFTDLQGRVITTPARDGYYLVFLPGEGDGMYYGMSVTRADGRTTVVSKPQLDNSPG